MGNDINCGEKTLTGLLIKQCQPTSPVFDTLLVHIGQFPIYMFAQCGVVAAECAFVLFFYCKPGCMEQGCSRYSCCTLVSIITIIKTCKHRHNSFIANQVVWSRAAPGTLVWMKRTMSIIIVVGAIIKTCKHHHNSFIANQVVWSMAALVWVIHPL